MVTVQYVETGASEEWITCACSAIGALVYGNHAKTFL